MKLTAKGQGLFKNDYELSADGKPLTYWNAKSLRSGGSFPLDGRTYEVKANILATQWELTDETGMLVAVAERVGRKNWTITSGGRTYAFERASIFRLEERLIVDGKPAGSIRRKYLHSDVSHADLPGLPAPIQVFAFIVSLSGWDLADAAG
ncbi:hypothetical protein [Plantactinospora soyae]|uniref:Uncharacterized protein n=1 Tax=Plantactinospora soyae TaxID=1544732 RepID=A0A927M9Q5_9ACTN|nr:hypothetical protein [Plantactinospora soyae]MBE1489221.1 hypothetical protein [Plantactinospora soyae]